MVIMGYCSKSEQYDHVCLHISMWKPYYVNVHRVASQQMYILHNDASVNSSSVGKVVACMLWYDL